MSFDKVGGSQPLREIRTNTKTTSRTDAKATLDQAASKGITSSSKTQRSPGKIATSIKNVFGKNTSSTSSKGVDTRLAATTEQVTRPQVKMEVIKPPARSADVSAVEVLKNCAKLEQAEKLVPQLRDSYQKAKAEFDTIRRDFDPMDTTKLMNAHTKMFEKNGELAKAEADLATLQAQVKPYAENAKNILSLNKESLRKTEDGSISPAFRDLQMAKISKEVALARGVKGEIELAQAAIKEKQKVLDLQSACREIPSTEKTYVRGLKQLDAELDALMSQPQYKKLVGEASSKLKAHLAQAEAFEKQMSALTAGREPTPADIGHLYNQSSFLKDYINTSRDYIQLMPELNRTLSKVDLKAVYPQKTDAQIREVETIFRNNPILVVQRAPRHDILLKELSNHAKELVDIHQTVKASTLRMNTELNTNPREEMNNRMMKVSSGVTTLVNQNKMKKEDEVKLKGFMGEMLTLVSSGRADLQEESRGLLLKMKENTAMWSVIKKDKDLLAAFNAAYSIAEK